MSPLWIRWGAFILKKHKHTNLDKIEDLYARKTAQRNSKGYRVNISQSVKLENILKKKKSVLL